MNQLSKILISIFILFININCQDGTYNLMIDVYNNTTKLIYIVEKERSFDENTSKVDPGVFIRVHGLLGSRYKHAKPSTRFEYIIVQDSDREEILNLQGGLLDNALVYDDEGDTYIRYRLDVN